MERSEQEAIRQILAGDPDAYRVLVERHLPSVRRIALRITGSLSDAEEATQEAFLRAYNRLPGFRHDAAFSTWIHRITVNCALNLVERRTRDLTWNATQTGSDGSSLLPVPDTSPNPERSLLSRESTSLREEAMASLTPMERTAFVLRHMEDLPISEIALALNVPGNSAKQAIFRAVAKLRSALAPLVHPQRIRS